jgi:hypothetical protein
MRKKYLPVLWLLSPSAVAETMLERLCFASAQEARQAISILDTVLVKGQDEILPEGPCLNVRVEEKRADVFQRWVTLRLPHATPEFSTMNAPARTCEIQVGRRQNNKQTSETIQAGTSAITVRAQGAELVSDEISTLNLLSGKSGTIMMENRQVDITCTFRASGRYHVRISLKPLPPPVTLFPPPPTKNEIGLSTEIEVSPGVEVSLGQIVEDLVGKEAGVSLPIDGSANQRKDRAMTAWWLKILTAPPQWGSGS